MHVGISGLQKKTLESLELKLQRAVSCRVRVMELNLGLLQEREVLFIPDHLSQPSGVILHIVLYESLNGECKLTRGIHLLAIFN